MTSLWFRKDNRLMHGLLEIVFEDVPADRLASIVVDHMGDEANIIDTAQDGVPFPTDAVEISRRISHIALLDGNVACNINLKAMKIDEKSVPYVTLRIIRYDLKTDASILFTSTDCNAAQISTADELHQWAMRVGEKYGAKNFYGGLDPAEDEKTRLFSGTCLGPHLTI
jgi:hypothetical protein